MKTDFKLVVSSVIADVADLWGVLKHHLVALSGHQHEHPARLVCDALLRVRRRGRAKLQHR